MTNDKTIEEVVKAYDEAFELYSGRTEVSQQWLAIQEALQAYKNSDEYKALLSNLEYHKHQEKTAKNWLDEDAAKLKIAEEALEKCQYKLEYALAGFAGKMVMRRWGFKVWKEKREKALAKIRDE